ncbi:conserved protein of unknown function [Tenacibaculum sp. 190524A02b]|uniref:hypothetical protein n=1 Tax=Tenacibaculum vairaonense TaxID=3137860 RepID=UPI0032B2CBC1
METKKVPTKKDNLKSLYLKIDNKTKFLQSLADFIGRSPNTLKNHWFANFWSVPDDLIDEVIMFMQNYIKIQEELKKNK